MIFLDPDIRAAGEMLLFCVGDLWPSPPGEHLHVPWRPINQIRPEVGRDRVVGDVVTNPVFLSVLESPKAVAAELSLVRSAGRSNSCRGRRW